jgi:hypothetical protein
MTGFREAVGLLTLLALVVATWSLFALLRDDPGADRFTVVLLFEDAEGIGPGTPLKTRGVTVGEVHRILLAPGGRGTEVLCSIESAPGATPRVGSRFWIVRPWFGGIAAGGGGLDTLIKDSYVAYDVGDPATPELLDGARVPGMRFPPDNPSALLDLPPAQGDLEFEVRFPDSNGLLPARPVRYRGIDVGLVSAVDLLPDGRGVTVRARVDRRHRHLVHSESEFWIDGVRVKADWGGISLDGLDAALTGASLSFHTPRRAKRAPAADGAILAGVLERPELDLSAIPVLPASRDPEALLSRGDPALRTLVTVHYSCLERDWIGADDRYERTSPGVLHRTLDGLAAVLVTSRAVDGRLWVEDVGGTPEIEEEAITVRHPDGTVQEAGIAWRGPRETDLALLRLPRFPAAAPTIAPRLLPSEELAGPVELLSIDPGGGWRRVLAESDPTGALAGVPAETADSVVLRAGVPIGLWRAAQGRAKARWIRFDELPPGLRPAPSSPPAPTGKADGR